MFKACDPLQKQQRLQLWLFVMFQFHKRLLETQRGKTVQYFTKIKEESKNQIKN